jgi:hypothetical protein
MKKAVCIFLPILFFFLASCEKEEALPEAGILEIMMDQSPSVQEPQEITVRVHKPTPCYRVSETRKTVSGTTFSYDIILVNDAEICAAVIAEEDVKVIFDPTKAGKYTLNFLINGKLYKTRTVTVRD